MTVLTNKNSSGPTRFLRNLENSSDINNAKFERYFIRRSRVALVFLKAPSNFFYDLCEFHHVKIVLRVDGFYNPEQFNNLRSSSGSGSVKCMTESRIKLNYEMQLALLKADWVIYQSDFSKSMLDKYLFHRTRNFSIIPNGVNLSHFSPSSSLSNEKNKIIIFGTLRDVDLLECSLESFKIFSQSCFHIDLRIIGSMTDELSDFFTSWIRQNEQISHRVEYLGSLSFNQLPRYLSTCLVSISIKSGDWCPNAVLELLACGVPIVCQKFGGTSELVGDAGISIDMGEYHYSIDLSHKVSDALEKIIENHIEFKNKAIRRAKQYDIEDVSSQYISVLSKYA